MRTNAIARLLLCLLPSVVFIAMTGTNKAEIIPAAIWAAAAIAYGCSRSKTNGRPLR